MDDREPPHRYDRDQLRYPSDLTDAEWQLVEPLIPPAKCGGGKRTVNMREVVNGIDERAETRLPMALHSERPAAAQHRERLFLPVGPWTARWRETHHALYVRCREQAEREASPTACMIDSPSVKGAEKGVLAFYDFTASMLGQADEGQEAPCAGRHVGPAVARAGDCRGRPGSRRRHPAFARHFVRTVPVLVASSLPIAPMQGRFSTRGCRQSHAQLGGRDRPACLSRQRFCCRTRSAGSSNVRSHGSTAAAGSPRIGKIATTTRSPSFTSLQSASCWITPQSFGKSPDGL